MNTKTLHNDYINQFLMEVDEEITLNSVADMSQKNGTPEEKAANKETKSIDQNVLNQFVEPVPPSNAFSKHFTNSKIFNLAPSRYQCFKKLFDSFNLGLNGVSLSNLPINTIFKSSLPSTPISTPVHKKPIHHFNEDVLHQKLIDSPHSIPNSQASSYFPSSDQSSIMFHSDADQPMDISLTSVEKKVSNSQSDNSFQSTVSTPSFVEKRVFISNIGYNIKYKDLFHFLVKFGKIQELELVRDHIKKTFKGFAFVEYFKSKDAQALLEAKPEKLIFQNRTLKVYPARPKKSTSNAQFKYQPSKNQHINAENLRLKDSKISANIPMHTFNQIPDKLLFEIFLHLSDYADKAFCERVCRKWNYIIHLTYHSEISLNLTKCFYSFNAKELSPDILKSFLKKRPNLKEINLSMILNKPCHIYFPIINEHCQKLENLNLSKTPIYDDDLIRLVKCCFKLKQINLSECTKITELGLSKFLMSNQSLVKLTITKNNLITGKCFHFLNKDIKELDIQECPQVQELAFDKLVNFGNRNIQVIKATLNAAALSIICKNCKKLIEMEITIVDSNSYDLSKLKFISSLKVLKIKNLSKKIEDEVLIKIFSSCSNLENFELAYGSYVSDKPFLKISKLCPNLKKLVIHSSSMSDKSFEALAQLRKLQSLVTTDCYVTDVGVKNVLFNCSYLNYLDINYCKNVTFLSISFAFKLYQNFKKKI